MTPEEFQAAELARFDLFREHLAKMAEQSKEDRAWQWIRFVLLCACTGLLFASTVSNFVRAWQCGGQQ